MARDPEIKLVIKDAKTRWSVSVKQRQIFGVTQLPNMCGVVYLSGFPFDFSHYQPTLLEWIAAWKAYKLHNSPPMLAPYKIYKFRTEFTKIIGIFSSNQTRAKAAFLKATGGKCVSQFVNKRSHNTLYLVEARLK